MRLLLRSVLLGQPLLYVAYSQSLPYNPTTVLLPSDSSKDSDIAYVFLPNAESSTHQLASLNISSTISQSNLSLEIITSSLPFTSDNSTAFIPCVSSDGEISVYAGSCSTSSSASLWRFSPGNTSTIGNGTWTTETTTTSSDVTSADLPGADFLSRAFSFSSLAQANTSQTDLYIFGGMCPTSGATTATWQSAANYSNHMLKLSPSSSTGYTLDLADSRGPPIAEAGFTITGLSPTYSNISGVLTQSQNFVLIGGHTASAFINMSTVAIWSLPEETWGFETAESPSSSNVNTKLTVKSTVTSVDSRSGHTAVLTEDGSKIIVLGGWVGDISQAADPQLAILNIASGFGGSGDWSWSVPTQQPNGTGMYGHGAVILPGNIMMVLGGFNITSSTSSKRQTSSGTQVSFFNTTSLSWISNYTNPSYGAATAKTGTSSSLSNATKIGLGAGLGLGLAAIIGAIILCLWYSRRLKRTGIEEREKTIQSLSRGAVNQYYPTREMDQRPDDFPWSDGRWNRNDDEFGHLHHGYHEDHTSAVLGYENLNAGVHTSGDGAVLQATPMQISQKPVKSRNFRGVYQAAPTSDFTSSRGQVRANSLGTAGPIHPIYEADEDDNMLPLNDTGVGIALEDPSFAPGPSNLNRSSDPFRDPPMTTYSTTLRRDNSIMTNETDNPAQSREREIQEWISDWAAADALLKSQAKSHSQAGRLSPTRRAQLIAAASISSVSGEEDSGRTASNLSERSIAASALSISRSGSGSQGYSRSDSLRGFITNATSPFTNTILSTTVTSTNISPTFDGPGRLKDSKPPGSSSSGSSSFTTAKTSFPTLQAEGVTLLPRPESIAMVESPATYTLYDPPGSPSKNKPLTLGKGRQIGWLGSLKRGFFGGGDSGTEKISPTSKLLPGREPSPIRVGGPGSPPRRTVSAGATLWRRKQGRSDWEDSASYNPGNRRSDTFTGDAPFMGASGMESDDDDWDIERAVQNRVVQVMFTVPKERLRVVNHTVEDDRSEIESLRSKGGSNKSLRATGPGPSLGSIGEAETQDMTEGKRDWTNSGLRMVEPGPSLEPVGEANPTATPEGKGKGKSKVLTMVEQMEERNRHNSPER